MEMPVRGGKVALVSPEDYEELRRYRWSLHSGGYGQAVVGSNEQGGGRKVYMHRLVMWAQPNQYVDHINMNKLDNRRENLRLVTFPGNRINRWLQSNSASGHKGVTWSKRDGKWRAQIQVEGKMYNLGTFCSLQTAILAYKLIAITYHGEYYREA